MLIAALTSSSVASNHSPPGRRDTGGDERGVDVVVGELACRPRAWRARREGSRPLEVRVGGAELLLDPLARGALGRLRRP